MTTPIGPDATSGSTYFELQAEDRRRELAAMRLGRWASEVPAQLPAPGEVPPLTGGPWATPDGLGVDAPVDVNHPDPSGVERHKGTI